jgi:hypothetical protein
LTLVVGRKSEVCEKLNDMRKIKSLLLMTLLMSVFISSCKDGNEEEGEKVTNSGKTVAENGQGKKDSIDFDCIGCEENIKDVDLFNDIIEEATKLTREGLNYPLSFMPKSISLSVAKEDSLYYFDNNKKIENVLSVFAEYKYIGKNGYGNELEGDALKTFYVKDNRVTNLEDEIRLEKLRFDDYINRTLDGSRNGEFIELTPTKDKSIILKTSLTCLEEGAELTLTLENDQEIKMNNWNDFNCEGLGYFRWFNKASIEKIKNSRLKYLIISSGGDIVLVRVSKNNSDYLQQLIALY